MCYHISILGKENFVMFMKFTHDELDLSNVSAKLFKEMETRTSGDLHYNFDGKLAEPLEVTKVFLGAVGLKLFFDNNLKNETPAWLKGDKELINAYEEGAKKIWLKDALKKAEDVLYTINTEGKDKDVVELDLSKYNFDYATISVIFTYLMTKGWYVNWNQLDHAYNTIHENWVCKFTKGKTVTAETLVACTISRLATRDYKLAYVDMWEDPSINSYGLKKHADDNNTSM